MTTPPGWYADPAGRPLERFWDGNAWTDGTRPQPQPQPTFAASTSSPTQFHASAQRTAPWYARKRVIVPAAILGTLIVVGAISSANQPAPNHKTTGDNIGTTSATESRARATPAPSTASGAATPVGPAATTLAAAKPTHTVASPSRTSKPAPTRVTTADTGSFRMPNEIGAVLQTAQDDVQRVSGDPVFFTHSHDLLGTRFQIFDRDWKVCSQNLRAGTTVSAVGHIDFGVVKLYETCP